MLSAVEAWCLIYGITRVADVYRTEFMRLFHHFYFRNLVDKLQAGAAPAADDYLDTTNAWAAPYYQASTNGFIQPAERLLC